MAGRPQAMAELTRRAFRWHGMSRRHLHETDKPNHKCSYFYETEEVSIFYNYVIEYYRENCDDNAQCYSSPQPDET